jgi:hypothetical protein
MHQTSFCDVVQLFGHVANELLHVSCVKTLGVKTLGVETLGVETLGQHAVHNDELPATPATVDICAASEERKEA